MIPLLDETVPLNVHQLWDLLFDMAFQQKFHTKVGDRDQQIGTWQRQGKFMFELYQISPIYCFQITVIWTNRQAAID